jgi:serine protease
MALLLGSIGLSTAVADARVVDGEAAITSSTDQVIVIYQAGAGRLGPAAITRAAGIGSFRLRALDGQRDVVKLSQRLDGAALQRVIDGLAAQPGVAAVEPDGWMVPMRVPGDARFPEQWDLTDPTVSGVYGINAPGAWDITTGSASVAVAVLDTGYVSHADLAPRVVGGYDFVSDSRIGNDGNGRDGDASDPGDWITSAEASSGFFRGCPVSDSSWHGTHVAGTIGASTDNGTGIAGINWGSNLTAIRVLGKCGGYTSDIVDGLRWAAGLSVAGAPSNPNPAKVLNLSLGGSGSCSSTWQSAINQVTSAGATVVVAAGNSNANASRYSPASCAGVISVASTGKAGGRAYYSNYGSTVEIAAPGGDSRADSGDTILSTLNTGSRSPAGDSYVRYQGTSMAAPHVAGVASLVLSVDPTLTPAEVTSVLQTTARAFPTGSTCAGACGAGIVDAAAAVAAVDGSEPPPPPPPPPAVKPGAFDKSSPRDGLRRRGRRPTLRWEASAGAAQYRVCIDTVDNDVCDTTWTTVSSTQVRVRLNRSTTYYWQVEAINADGSTSANGGDWWSFRIR